MTRLDLHDNRLGITGVTALAKAIAQSGTPLSWLSVSSNRLGGLAAAALLQGLATIEPPTLEVLDISHNRITEGAAAAYETMQC